MFSHPKVMLAVAFMMMSVAVDFTSTILSMASDGLLIGAAVFLIHQELSSKKE
jgi:hypothetical protein